MPVAGALHETAKNASVLWKRFWHEAVRFMHNENGQALEDIPRRSTLLYFFAPAPPPSCWGARWQSPTGLESRELLSKARSHFSTQRLQAVQRPHHHFKIYDPALLIKADEIDTLQLLLAHTGAEL